MFEKITIRTIDKNGWPIDFELKSGTQAGPALQWLEKNGYEPALEQTANYSYEEYTFPAESMSATVDDGKVYWKVKGGAFVKFGVRIWEEALVESGFLPSKLDPMKPLDLRGYTAYLVVNKKGHPKKVVRLEKA